MIDRYDAAHSGKGLENIVDRLRKACLGPPIQTGIALEVSWGALVETLAEAGFSVFSVNPKQSDRFRDRHTAAGAKDDSRDALVLASALKTDLKSFKSVQMDDPSTIRLRELSRLDEELKNELHRAANQLWEQLHRYFPQMLKLSSGADDPFVWALLNEAPMPAKAQGAPRGADFEVSKDSPFYSRSSCRHLKRTFSATSAGRCRSCE